MNFEELIQHHVLNEPIRPWLVHGIDLGLSKHLIVLWIVSAVVTVLMTYAARAKSRPAAVLRTGVEAVALYFRDQLLHPVFHEHTDTYLPYFLTLFFFLFTANLIGLVPFSASVTGNISVTAALAICTFVLVHFAGVREQGLVEYVKHICPGGLPWWLVPMIFCIEILGLCAKCIALCIRLFANMFAGHVVSLAFLSLIFIFAGMNHWVGLAVAPFAVGMALFVALLDVLVSLIQAFIFTFLTAIFVGGAVHPH